MILIEMYPERFLVLKHFLSIKKIKVSYHNYFIEIIFLKKLILFHNRKQLKFIIKQTIVS